ncbi:hypothetical protein P5673_024279, partial [Acropora cervicornis]
VIDSSSGENSTTNSTGALIVSKCSQKRLCIIFRTAQSVQDRCKEEVKNKCPRSLQIDWWEIPPYVYKDKDRKVVGIFPDILSKLVKECCYEHPSQVAEDEDKRCVQLNFTEVASNDSEVVKKHIGMNGTVMSMPIYGDMKDVTFQGHPFYPVVESPGVVFIVKKEDSTNAAKAVMDAVFQGWPDTYWNPDEFPRSFFKGTWEGFWWAFVSMTTVGYGDRAPRSVLARAFAFVWVLIGLVIISIFTATVTTSLTAISLSNDIKLYGSKVVALKNTEEQRLGVRNNAKVTEKNAVGDLKTLVLKQEVSGALLDSYVAGYWATSAPNKVLKDSNLRVGTVLDHQFAYGFVIAGELEKDDTTKCMRKKLNSMETEITSIIQEKAKTMEDTNESAAVEKTNNLFDAESPMFRRAIYSYVERIVTPETSYESLVAMQCAEIEDAMMNEVQRFYIAWNKKLEELKKRNGGQLGGNELSVMGMGVNSGEMRSM